MGIKKRDERDKLKSQNLIDSEKSVHFVTGSTEQGVTGVAAVADVQQQQGSSTMYSSSSTSSSSSKMQSASSSSTSKSVIEHVAASGAHDVSQKMSESKSSTSGKESQQGQKFSDSTGQVAQIGSKQIENIIQEIKYIASDTVDSTKRISTVQKISDSSKCDKELREALTNFDEVAKATISDIQGSTKSHTSEKMSVSNVQKSMSSSKMVQSSSASSTVSSSAIKQSSMSSSEKMISDQSSSSAHHASSSVMKSSNVSSSKTQSSSTSKSFLDSSTFLSDSADVQKLTSDSNLKDTKLTIGGQLRDFGGDHSVLQQSSTFHVDGSGGKRYADSQSYSMAEKNAPTTEVTYDSAGNKITSTKSSSASAQGFTSSTFQTSGGTYAAPSGGNVVQSSSSAHDTNHATSSSSTYMSSSAADQRVSSSSTKSTSTLQNSNLKSSVIDSTSLENYKIQDSSQLVGGNMLTKDVSAHTITSLSSAHDSLGNTIQSTQLATESTQDTSSHQKQHAETTKTYESSSHFEKMDEKSSSRKKVTDYYEQRESNAAILKRKTYDEKVKRLSLIDQKIVPKDVIIQDIEDDVTNVTRTSFEAKLFNPKTKRWELVDQKTILEKDITVAIPEEIVHELEVERPELANITTTIQLTKVGPRRLILSSNDGF